MYFKSINERGRFMEKYLNRGIKDIIDENPQVGTILDEYDIGCVPCNVGTCLLKDIVDIHNLTGDQEAKLMFKLAEVFYPGKDIKIPKVNKAAAKSHTKEISYSPPMKLLVEEHKLIKRLLAVIPNIIEKFDINSEDDTKLILNCVDFIKSYADKFHHAKEEDILFKFFEEGLDIIQVMYKDHETARHHVKTILEAVAIKNETIVREHLKGYQELLSEHIKREDEILYPWMDRNLTMPQVGKLYSAFQEAEHGLTEKDQEKYRAFIQRVEKSIL